ncbi:hypothetical protein L207DRAFT_419157 [Hyaloscypha variabilis F]|uniref:Nuclear pore complex protein Nup85 n=1 Tax=Hyaloscypha variabilis (strain UAMH 11265 / GT02V1 / F) TaxID=1149755 RepID=A0A2J6S3G2_HYAVF|nr:hypothetical protein L207DRAFT_419157 [Hyaloscypha variabilis F]
MGNGSPLKPLSFSQQSTFESPSSPSASFLRPSVAPQRSGLSNEYQASSRGPFQAPYESEDEGDSADFIEEEDQQYNDNRAYIDEDADGMTDEDAQYDDDEAMDDYQSEIPASRTNGRGYDQHSASDLLLSTPGALRRSREGGKPGQSDYLSQSLQRPRESIYGSIAKDLYTRMPAPDVTEADELILNTETIITRLYEQGIGASEEEDKLQEALMTIPGDLVTLWEDYDRNTRVYDSEEYTTAIGPGPKATSFQKANYVAGLAIQVHHPQRGAKLYGSNRLKPLPQVMLEWLDEHHNVFPSYLEEVQHHRPSPSNSRLFWSTLFNSLIRGKIVAVVNLLKDAGWKHARNDSDVAAGQYGGAGFSGVALQNVEKVAKAAVEVFQQCPPARGDWNIRGSEWTLFRLRISQAMEELKSYAEGNSRDRSDTRTYGKSSLAGQSGTYSKAAQKAESKVPWHIYQNMVTLYSIAMGDSNAIVEVCGDWVEAAAGLLVWWDEGKDDRRQAFNRSQNNYRASLRDNDAEYYLHKLRKSFQTATDKDTDFAVNTADEVEVSLASLFEGDNEAIVGFLRGWSGPVSSAVAEVASLGGWLPQAEAQSLINMGSLDQEDLDLLGVDSSPSKTDGVKDLTLITYAKSLTHRGTMKRPNPSGSSQTTTEGWELAIAILGRLDSTTRSEEIVGDFLHGFPLTSTNVVDKLWKLLNETGMSGHAESVAESYATRLAEDSHKYGEALWYYALAHKIEKVKDVLDLLISFSLIQSIAFPPEAELDDHLRRLVASPKDALTEISRMDFEAAELLHKMLSGYATLRKYYNLRDEAVVLKDGVSKNGAVARKIEAASALMAVISSSDDNIRGGLYDEERGAIVNVDFLLALLGEAMVFVNQADYTITVDQIDILLKAIEDLQTVGPRVYSACAEFLQTVIASGRGLKGSSPTDMLRKTTSNSSGSSSFSMIGSSMVASQLKQSMSSSGVLVKGNIKRGWDWRQGISASTKGDDVLRILRLGLAKDLAKAWLNEADSKM